MFVDQVAVIVSAYAMMPYAHMLKSRDADAVNARRLVIAICREYGRGWTEIRRVLLAYADNDAVKKAYARHLEQTGHPLAYDSCYDSDYRALLAIVAERFGEPDGGPVPGLAGKR